MVGQVGSGKSSLLSAILGEIHKVSGTVNVEVGIKGNFSVLLYSVFCIDTES